MYGCINEFGSACLRSVQVCVHVYLIWDYNCAIYCDFVISMWHKKVIMPCKILSGISIYFIMTHPYRKHHFKVLKGKQYSKLIFISLNI